jgi:hypothetical protein
VTDSGITSETVDGTGTDMKTSIETGGHMCAAKPHRVCMCNCSAVGVLRVCFDATWQAEGVFLD